MHQIKHNHMKTNNNPPRLKLRNYRIRLLVQSLVIASTAVLLLVILLSRS